MQSQFESYLSVIIANRRMFFLAGFGLWSMSSFCSLNIVDWIVQVYNFQAILLSVEFYYFDDQKSLSSVEERPQDFMIFSTASAMLLPPPAL